MLRRGALYFLFGAEVFGLVFGEVANMGAILLSFANEASQKQS